MVLKFSLLLLILFLESTILMNAQQVSFNNNQISVELNIYGRIRISFQGTELLESITLLAGTAEDKVFDFYKDSNLEDSISVLSGKYHELYGGFNNDYSNLPPDIIERVGIYSPPNEPFTLLRFNIQNDTTELITAKIGLDINSRIGGSFSFDSVLYNDTANVVHIFKNQHHVGFKLLSDSLSTLAAFNWQPSYYTDSNYWNLLNQGIMDSLFYSGEDGPIIILSQPFVNLNPGESVFVDYAIAYGSTDSMMLANIRKTESMFLNLTPVKEKLDIIPDNFFLYQNFPNPFNPETKISFSIPSEELVTLKVYSLLGEEIEVIINEKLNPGRYTYTFYSTNLPSGIYFYKINAGRFSETKKMILVK